MCWWDLAASQSLELYCLENSCLYFKTYIDNSACISAVNVEEMYYNLGKQDCSLLLSMKFNNTDRKIRALGATFLQKTGQYI